MLDIENKSSEQILTTKTFSSDFRLSPGIYRDAPNWKRKPISNSNNNNILLGCPTQSRNISWCLKLNSGSSREIQMVKTFHSEVRFRRLINRDARNWTMEARIKFEPTITFYSDVRLSPVIYRDARNSKQKLSRNSNGHNFSLGGPIQAHNISRRPKLNNRCSREIQMVITFNSEDRFRRIIYRDIRNWKTEALEKFKWS